VPETKKIVHRRGNGSPHLPWDRSDGEIGCTAPARERHNIGLRLDISKTAVRQSDCAAPIAGHAQGELGVVGGRTNDARNGW